MCKKIPRLEHVRAMPKISPGGLPISSINSEHINIYIYIYTIKTQLKYVCVYIYVYMYRID